MNKKISKWLKQEAEKLPPEVGVRVIKQRFTGNQLKGDGITKLANGKSITNNSKYTTTTNETYTVDHYQKLKECYTSGGKIAVNNYINNAKAHIHLQSSDTQKLAEEANQFSERICEQQDDQSI
jgi:hypothetical protein